MNKDDFVGAQKFTYGELECAWNELKSFFTDDRIVHDIRNGYSVTESRDCNENQWFADWNFDSICKTVESVGKTITFGDLEVYWNNPEYNDADTEGHGIIIEDGEILKVY